MEAIDMKIWLDDKKDAPRGWQRCYWPDEVIDYLARGLVTEVSLDHDLGDDDRGTGNDVIIWIENRVATTDFVPPLIHVHTENSSARPKMLAGVGSITRLYRKRSRR
jgi:hypothetical protein